MKRFCSIILFIVLVGCSTAPNNKHWTYTSAEGPEHLAELSESFYTCESGKNQSPVNIQDPFEAELDTLTFNYSSSISAILHNGHTVQYKARKPV